MTSSPPYEVRLRDDLDWSDGEHFNADDVIFTLDTYFGQRESLTWWGVNRITNYVSDYEKIDDYTVRMDTFNPAYDFSTVLGVYTWGSAFNIVPEHIFSQVENISEFRNTIPVTLGPYVVKEFDPNGFWQLWELREDWERSAWGFLDDDGYMPQYILYKDYGPEETRSLSFVQNAYDVDTFMSPDGIKAAQARNSNITTFSPQLPYHNMDDACSYGILLNMQKAPLDDLAVRWALALSIDLKSVGINALSGEFKASPLPMVDTQILRPIYFDPNQPFLRDLELSDGYKPFDEGFAADLAANLRAIGTDESQIPQTAEDLSVAFGVGWWNHDPAEAESLLLSAGFSKNDAGNYVKPDGEEWVLDFVIPGDWNKVMQRVGFSVADSWRKAGLQVNVRQVDNAEFGVVQNTNSQREAILQWTNCIFNANYLNAWQSVRVANVQAGGASDPNSGNVYQWASESVDGLIDDATQLETTAEEFYAIGRQILQEFVTDMAYINMMNIPTTIPTNETYFKNWPKQDNYYAVPYSWWSSIKSVIARLEQTGA